jgi:hypothetical protein
VKAPKESIRIFVALTALVIATVLPIEVTETSPAVEVRVAPVRFVKSPDPESVTFPTAWIAPVGATEVPPLMAIVPAELMAAAPEYVDEGVIVMSAEFEVVRAALTATVVPEIEMSPAAVIAPETVGAPELVMSTMPREVMGAPLVNVEELVSRTVAALTAPLPVLKVDSALLISRPWAAVTVAVVLL